MSIDESAGGVSHGKGFSPPPPEASPKKKGKDEGKGKTKDKSGNGIGKDGKTTADWRYMKMSTYDRFFISSSSSSSDYPEQGKGGMNNSQQYDTSVSREEADYHNVSVDAPSTVHDVEVDDGKPNFGRSTAMRIEEEYPGMVLMADEQDGQHNQDGQHYMAPPSSEGEPSRELASELTEGEAEFVRGLEREHQHQQTNQIPVLTEGAHKFSDDFGSNSWKSDAASDDMGMDELVEMVAHQENKPEPDNNHKPVDSDEDPWGYDHKHNSEQKQEQERERDAGLERRDAVKVLSDGEHEEHEDQTEISASKEDLARQASDQSLTEHAEEAQHANAAPTSSSSANESEAAAEHSEKAEKAEAVEVTGGMAAASSSSSSVSVTVSDHSSDFASDAPDAGGKDNADAPTEAAPLTAEPATESVTEPVEPQTT